MAEQSLQVTHNRLLSLRLGPAWDRLVQFLYGDKGVLDRQDVDLEPNP